MHVNITQLKHEIAELLLPDALSLLLLCYFYCY